MRTSAPASSTSTRSVKVPPMSAPIRWLMSWPLTAARRIAAAIGNMQASMRRNPSPDVGRRGAAPRPPPRGPGAWSYLKPTVAGPAAAGRTPTPALRLFLPGLAPRPRRLLRSPPPPPPPRLLGGWGWPAPPAPPLGPPKGPGPAGDGGPPPPISLVQVARQRRSRPLAARALGWPPRGVLRATRREGGRAGVFAVSRADGAVPPDGAPGRARRLHHRPDERSLPVVRRRSGAHPWAPGG